MSVLQWSIKEILGDRMGDEPIKGFLLLGRRVAIADLMRGKAHNKYLTI